MFGRARREPTLKIITLVTLGDGPRDPSPGQMGGNSRRRKDDIELAEVEPLGNVIGQRFRLKRQGGAGEPLSRDVRQPPAEFRFDTVDGNGDFDQGNFAGDPLEQSRANLRRVP